MESKLIFSSLVAYQVDCKIPFRLNVALDRIAEINEEEVSFEWEKSLFPLQNQTMDKLMPHKRLFDAGQNFMDRYDLWMHTQVGIHDPSVIEKEILEVLKIITELEAIFAEKPETLKLTIDVRISFQERYEYFNDLFSSSDQDRGG